MLLTGGPWTPLKPGEPLSPSSPFLPGKPGLPFLPGAPGNPEAPEVPPPRQAQSPGSPGGLRKRDKKYRIDRKGDPKIFISAERKAQIHVEKVQDCDWTELKHLQTTKDWVRTSVAFVSCVTRLSSVSRQPRLSRVNSGYTNGRTC